MPTKGDAPVLPGARAIARHVRISPTKARRVIDLVRGLPAKEALTVLQFAPQQASEPVYKVLASAIANAENNERLDPDSLLVSEAFVDEGPTLKRFRPRAQGRAYRIRKRTCHITIAVESVPAAQRGRGARPAAGAAKAAPGKAAPAKAGKAARASKATAADVTEATAADVTEAEATETTEAPAEATKKAAPPEETAEDATEDPTSETAAEEETE